MSKKNKSQQARLITYNNNLKKSLKHGIRFTHLIDQLITTSNVRVLLSATEQLISYHLDTHWINYPYQYRSEDFNLIFMKRLLAEHHQAQPIQIKPESRRLVQLVTPLGNYDKFAFNADGDYQDSRYREKIFHLDLGHKVMYFNNQALTRLLVVHYYRHFETVKIKHLVRVWLAFGRILMTDYHFKVSFGILSSKNQVFYHFKVHQLPPVLMDKLFVMAAHHRYMLRSFGTGALLPLRNDLDIKIYAKHQTWGLSVQDSQERCSWLDILLKYDFIRAWYLNNIKHLRLA